MANNSGSWLLTDRIWQPIKRRTQRAYVQLFKNPAFLFGRGSRTVLFPNGAREIWISNPEGTVKFAITAGNGPAGFSVTIKTPPGTLPASAHVMTSADYVTKCTDGVREITFVAHYQDPYAQAFKAWYESDAKGDERPKHPQDLGLMPIDRVGRDSIASVNQ